MHRLAYFATAAVFAAVPVSVGLTVNSSLVEEVPVRVPRAATLLDSDGSALREDSGTRQRTSGDDHRRSARVSQKALTGSTYPHGRRGDEARVRVRSDRGGPGALGDVELLSSVSAAPQAGAAGGRGEVEPPRHSPSRGPGGGAQSEPDHGGGGGPGPSAGSGPGHSGSDSGGSGSGSLGSGSSDSSGSGGSGSGGSNSSGPGSSGDSGSDSSGSG
jgi:hypothetical protein